MDFEAAATITVAFATAYHGLYDVAGLKRGERILIHAAAGGVGLAAVQLARLSGAQIFATAHRTKWQRLREWGVEHIMDSRSTEFAEQILADTGGEGVDVVLNSLTGDFITKSLAVLRRGGRFVEIGKRDIWSTERVAQIREGVQYHVVDLLRMLSGDESCALDPVLDSLVRLFKSGQLRPLPYTRFSLDEVVQAFRYMQRAKHFGKVVVAHGDGRGSVGPLAQASTEVRADASYLITGGMGGLGLVAAEWLATRGARHIVLMGRRQPTTTAGATLQRLEQCGAKVTIVSGDVSNDDDVVRALKHIRDSLPPLRGVIHSAAVLDDAIILNHESKHFRNVFGAKIDGSWSLHVHTADLDLEFFILFSAGASLLGNRGQANYVAANSFLDSLAHFRRQRGLPAMAINWGPGSEVGLASQRGLNEQGRAKGLGSIGPNQGVAILDCLFTSNQVQVGVLPIHWAEAARHFAEWPFVSDFRAEASGAATNGSEFLGTLAAVPFNQRRALLASHVKGHVAAVLGLKEPDEIDPKQGFFDLGMDSLTAVELRNRLQASLACTIPATVAFDYPTVGGLIEFVSDSVLPDLRAAVEKSQGEHVPGDMAALLAGIEKQSDSEALQSLKRKRSAAGRNV
jgi:NADPH:quinone reductase-like Zn-dependent oxidoreductase/acyl carrier protein